MFWDFNSLHFETEIGEFSNGDFCSALILFECCKGNEV
jgi:hypothetical protein